VIGSFVAVKEWMEAPGWLGSWAVRDDRWEVLGLARGEAPQDSEHLGVVVGPADDNKLGFSFVPFEITPLADGKLDGCIKWHPPFISLSDWACIRLGNAPVALTSEGGGGLFAEVEFEWAAGELPVDRGPSVGGGPHHIRWGDGCRGRGRLDAAGVRGNGFAIIGGFVIISAVEGREIGRYKVGARVTVQSVNGRLGVRGGAKGRFRGRKLGPKVLNLQPKSRVIRGRRG
jgi:hypothetical protein